VGVSDGKNAGVANGGAADVGAQIFDGVLSVAKRQELEAPVPVPDLWINRRQITLLGQLTESLLKVFTEGGLRHGFGRQEGGGFDGDHAVVPVDARAGNDGMKVGVEEESLVPGVQDQGEAGGARSQGTGMSQGHSECVCRGLEEHTVDLLRKGSEEEWTQLGRERERHHEIGGTDAAGQLLPDPFCGGLFATLGTAAMVARMEPELARATRFTGMQVSTHRRRATVGDRPGGAKRIGVKAQPCRQEPA